MRVASCECIEVNPLTGSLECFFLDALFQLALVQVAMAVFGSTAVSETLREKVVHSSFNVTIFIPKDA